MKTAKEWHEGYKKRLVGVGESAVTSIQDSELEAATIKRCIAAVRDACGCCNAGMIHSHGRESVKCCVCLGPCAAIEAMDSKADDHVAEASNMVGDDYKTVPLKPTKTVRSRLTKAGRKPPMPYDLDDGHVVEPGKMAADILTAEILCDIESLWHIKTVGGKVGGLAPIEAKVAMVRELTQNTDGKTVRERLAEREQDDSDDVCRCGRDRRDHQRIGGM